MLIESSYTVLTAFSFKIFLIIKAFDNYFDLLIYRFQLVDELKHQLR